MSYNLSNLLYLITIVSFVLALRFLSNPAHARRGNQIGAAGMLLAIAVTWVKVGSTSWWAIAIAMVIGGGFGAVAALDDKLCNHGIVIRRNNGIGICSRIHPDSRPAGGLKRRDAPRGRHKSLGIFSVNATLNCVA